MFNSWQDFVGGAAAVIIVILGFFIILTLIFWRIVEEFLINRTH